MPSIRVTHSIGDLASDIAKIPPRAVKDMKATVRKNTIEGNRIAKGIARQSAGAHGKLYPRSFTWETGGFLGFGGGEFTGTYGPDGSRPQGGMSFEYGSRNQPPHLDLNKSADIIGPRLANDVQDLPGRWFW